MSELFFYTSRGTSAMLLTPEVFVPGHEYVERGLVYVSLMFRGGETGWYGRGRYGRTPAVPSPPC